jgi:hypothetical protein
LEELIPHDVRSRWRITTHTSLVFEEPRGAPKTESEFQYEYTIVNKKESLLQFIAEHNVPKLEDGKGKEDRVKRIRDWAMSHGYRIRLMQ